MSSLFSHATSFGGDLSAWNVSSVTDMRQMFFGATSFGGDLSALNVSSVTDMACMFDCATSFVGDLSTWNVSSAVTCGTLQRVKRHKLYRMIWCYRNMTRFVTTIQRRFRDRYYAPDGNGYMESLKRFMFHVSRESK